MSLVPNDLSPNQNAYLLHRSYLDGEEEESDQITIQPVSDYRLPSPQLSVRFVRLKKNWRTDIASGSWGVGRGEDGKRGEYLHKDIRSSPAGTLYCAHPSSLRSPHRPDSSSFAGALPSAWNGDLLPSSLLQTLCLSVTLPLQPPPSGIPSHPSHAGERAPLLCSQSSLWVCLSKQRHTRSFISCPVTCLCHICYCSLGKEHKALLLTGMYAFKTALKLSVFGKSNVNLPVLSLPYPVLLF